MINHLWQSTIFAVAIGLLALALQKNRASIRHSLWLAASIKFLIPLTLLMSLGRQVQPAAPQLARPFATAAEQLTAPFSEPIDFTAAGTLQHFNWTPQILRMVLAIWILGFLAIACMRLRAWLQIRALIRTSGPSSLSLPIETRSTTGRLGPGVVGIWKPVLLLPVNLEQNLTPEQFQSVIAHELTHVRRRDNLYAAIHMFVEATFWFHPLVWWIGQRLVEERELACDEAVLAQGGNPSAYAEAILGVCKHYVESPLALVSGVTRADIKKRLEAILTPRNILGLDWTRKLLLATAACITAFMPFLAGIAAAQSSKFDVASIKPHPLQGKGGRLGSPVRIDGNRVSLSVVTLNELIATAYDIRDFQIAGAPDWATQSSDRYDIAAKAPGDLAPTIDQARQMLQTLLADRFHLAFRRESKELPVYHLSVGNAGAKVKMVEADAARPTAPTQRLPFATLLNLIAGFLDRPLVDQTGLSGRVDFQMDFGSLDKELLSITTAVQDSLGLKLEPAKDLMSILVVEHAERPSQN